MKFKIPLVVGVTACVGAALWMREIASWRPVLLGKVPQTGSDSSLQLSPDGRFLVAGSRSIFDLQIGKWAPPVPVNENFYGFANSDSYFCARYDPGQGQTYASHVWRRDLGSGRAVWKALELPPARDNFPLSVLLGPDLKRTWMVTETHLKTFDARGKLLSSRPIGRIMHGFLTPRAALITAEGFELLSRDTATLRPLWKASKSPFGMGDITSDGQTLWFVHAGRSHFLDAATGKERWSHPLIGDQGGSIPPTGFGFSGDARILAMANWTGVEFYSVQSGRFLGSKSGPGLQKCAAAVPSSDSNWLYTTDTSGQIWRWRVK